jgi:hypothetical protein
MLADPPMLSDEAAAEMLDFLYELINAFENHYRHQLQRHDQTHQPPQPDLFEDFDDELPTF